MDPSTLTLGSKVRDRITGLEGIATGRIEYMNGCWRCIIQAQQLKDGHPVEPYAADFQQVEVVEEAALPATTPPTQPLSAGGPQPPVNLHM